jgi:hypothetical protein
MKFNDLNIILVGAHTSFTMGKRKLQQVQATEPEPVEEEQVVQEAADNSGSEDDFEDAAAAAETTTADDDSGSEDDDDYDVMDDEPDDDSDTDIRDFRKRLKTKKVVPSIMQLKDTDETAASGDAAAGAVAFKSDGSYRNKQRVLMFSSRGVTSRYRHLLEDLRKLIPHHKKDVKVRQYICLT